VGKVAEIGGTESNQVNGLGKWLVGGRRLHAAEEGWGEGAYIKKIKKRDRKHDGDAEKQGVVLNVNLWKGKRCKKRNKRPEFRKEVRGLDHGGGGGGGISNRGQMS